VLCLISIDDAIDCGDDREEEEKEREEGMGFL
jgi:hypothetical protein